MAQLRRRMCASSSAKYSPPQKQALLKSSQGLMYNTQPRNIYIVSQQDDATVVRTVTSHQEGPGFESYVCVASL